MENRAFITSKSLISTPLNFASIFAHVENPTLHFKLINSRKIFKSVRFSSRCPINFVLTQFHFVTFEFSNFNFITKNWRNTNTDKETYILFYPYSNSRRREGEEEEETLLFAERERERQRDRELTVAADGAVLR